MGDLKLFKIGNETVVEIEGGASAVEKSLQTLMEKHLESFLGVRFLETEYGTGRTHGGRIDTLGIDENAAPVIIEYKRALNENVINQGLFYLDWLLDHKAEFELLVQKRLGVEQSNKIDWSGPRLICIAGDFTKYDEYAVNQINRNIELMRYAKYGPDLLLLELINARSADAASSKPAGHGVKNAYKTVGQYLDEAPKEVRDLYEELRAFLVALGDDVQEKQLQFYIAYKRIKNFACVEVHPATKKLLVFVKVDPDSISLEHGFTRDVRSIGHFGTGDLEISIRSRDDLSRGKDLISRSYEAS